MSPEQALFQKVVETALMDGIGRTRYHSKTAALLQRQADSWIRGGGRDFQEVCTLAGYDPAFIRDKYERGTIDITVLRKASEVRRERV